MNKIWLAHYPDGVPAKVKLDNAHLIDLFEQACQQYPQNIALTCHKVSLTFADVQLRVAKIAQGMRDLGVQAQDRIAIILPNCLQYPLTMFATLLIGATVVNINPLYTASEIEYILQDSQPTLVVTLDMFAEKLNNSVNKFGIKHIVVTKIADPYPWLKRTIINNLLRYISKVNPQLNYSAYNWRDLYYYQKEYTLTKHAPLSADDLAFIQYTGATTGRPKGAMLLHRNLVANIRQVLAYITPQMDNELSKQIIINALPLYHIFSLNANLCTFFFSGAENVMVPNARNIKDLIKTLNSTPFTVFNSLDSLYQKLLEHKEFTQTPHPHYRYGICGGMATRHSIAQLWKEATGLIPTNCYGLTEASPCVAMNLLNDEFNGSVGYPVPSTEVEIRDPETASKLLNHGETGLIMLRGPQIMLGYWRNPEQTAKVLDSDGWLNTGDLGYFNANGQLVISGRKTELIIVSGFNVYPAEVELVIDQLDAISEVAVIGLPDPHMGEAVYAYVVLKDHQHLTSQEIIQHCRRQLTKYKIPRAIYLVDSLPKTIVGKIDKQLLAKQAKPN
ncbi:MAG: hypothetical protein RLZZ293_1184 [Pseudomonadota bacterium]|jgi:long-chain acyl-CoA synthetase